MAAGLRDDDVCHVEVVDHRRGVDWVVPRLRELTRAHRPRYVVCDARGPGGVAADVARAPAPDRDRHERHPSTQQRRRRSWTTFRAAGWHTSETRISRPRWQPASSDPLGDAWAWSRRSSSFSDITPLCASVPGRLGRAPAATRRRRCGAPMTSTWKVTMTTEDDRLEDEFDRMERVAELELGEVLRQRQLSRYRLPDDGPIRASDRPGMESATHRTDGSG